MDDMTIDIDERIEYINCKPGDRVGIVKCAIPTGNSRTLIKVLRWDGINRTEIDCLANLKEFIQENT